MAFGVRPSAVSRRGWCVPVSSPGRATRQRRRPPPTVATDFPETGSAKRKLGAPAQLNGRQGVLWKAQGQQPLQHKILVEIAEATDLTCGSGDQSVSLSVHEGGTIESYVNLSHFSLKKLHSRCAGSLIKVGEGTRLIEPGSKHEWCFGCIDQTGIGSVCGSMQA